MVDARSLFEPVDDGCWLPTELARGPWDPRALHGGPVAALVARAIEGVGGPAEGAPMHPARLTLELVRPVPLEPLTVTTELVRPGRRVQLVAATLAVAATGVEVTRALALRIRENPDAGADATGEPGSPSRTASALNRRRPATPSSAADAIAAAAADLTGDPSSSGGTPAHRGSAAEDAAASLAAAAADLAGDRVAREDRLPPGPAHGSPPEAFFLPRSKAATAETAAFHSHGVEHRFVEGRFDEPGAATDWIRLRVPVVPGEEPSPWQRVAAAADFGNGLSGILDPSRFTFVNPDLTVTLRRLPEGEWVCLQAATRLGVDGVAVAESVLFDEHGRLGRAVQTLLVAPV